MRSLNQYEKVICEKCGTQTTKFNLARHKRSCSPGTLYCIHCPNFSTKSQSNLNYQIAKKHSAPKADVTFRCKLCYQEFPRLYALPQDTNTQHSTRIANRIGNKRCGCGTHSGRCWGSQVERRVAFLSTFLGGFRTWKGETQSIQLRSGNSQRSSREPETWSFYQQIEMCRKSESGFWFHFEKYRRWRVQIFLRTRKQYRAGSIQTCVHPWHLGNIERVSQQNRRHRVL